MIEMRWVKVEDHQPNMGHVIEAPFYGFQGQVMKLQYRFAVTGPSLEIGPMGEMMQSPPIWSEWQDVAPPSVQPC